MAKPKLTERVIEQHTLSAEGILDLESNSIEIEEVGALTLEDLLVNFDGTTVKLSVQTKTEKEIEDIEE